MIFYCETECIYKSDLEDLKRKAEYQEKYITKLEKKLESINKFLKGNEDSKQ